MAYSNLNNPANYQLQSFDQYGFRVMPAGMGSLNNLNEPISQVDNYRTILAIKDSVVSLRTAHGDTILNKSLKAGEELHGLFYAIDVYIGEVVGFLAGPFGTPLDSTVWFNLDGKYNYAVFPDNQFSFGTTFCFGFWFRAFSVERPKQTLVATDNFSIELRGKYLYVISFGQETKLSAVITPDEWAYYTFNISGTSLVLYRSLAYTLSDGVNTSFDYTYTATITAPDLSAVEQLRIGSDLNGENLFWGNYSYFSMWDRNVSLAENNSLRNGNISTYSASEKVDMLHHYQFSLNNTVNDLIGSPAVNGTINGL
jgi:hypothetical protein